MLEIGLTDLPSNFSKTALTNCICSFKLNVIQIFWINYLVHQIICQLLSKYIILKKCQIGADGYQLCTYFWHSSYLNLGAASNLLWGSLCMVSKYSGAVCNQEWVIIARVRYILKLGSGVISFMGFLCFPNGHDIQLLIYRSNQESGNLKYKQDFDAMLYCVPIITCSPDIVINSAFRVVQIFRIVRIIVLKKITNN